MLSSTSCRKALIFTQRTIGLFAGLPIMDISRLSSTLCRKALIIHAEGDHAVHWVARNGHLEVVKYFVSQGADIHADNDLAVR